MVNIALFSWPVVVAILFIKTRPSIALLVSLIGGYLLLPHGQGINFPLLPKLNKETIPTICAAVMAFVVLRNWQYQSNPDVSTGGNTSRILPNILPKQPLLRLFFALFLTGLFLTYLTNQDSLRYGPTFLPGIGLYETLSLLQETLIILIPFLLARKFLAHPDQHRILLIILAAAGALYAILALIEIRLSPQMNIWVYGYFPHSWRQHLRDGGYRPLVFLEHGIRLGLFFACCALAAFGAARNIDKKWRGSVILMGLFILGTIFLSKTLSALFIVLICLPAMALGTVRLQLLFAISFSAIIILYPALRGANLVPVEKFSQWVSTEISEDRAKSFNYRVFHEQLLLDRLQERPLFGWGHTSRWRVHNENGVDITTSDGYWIRIMSRGGWSRYIAEFGLLTLPIFLLWWRRKSYRISLETSALCIVLTANLMDLIPNNSITPITWIMAGALAGRLELQRIGETVGKSMEVRSTERNSSSRYARKGPTEAPVYRRSHSQDSTATRSPRLKR